MPDGIPRSTVAGDHYQSLRTRLILGTSLAPRSGRRPSAPVDESAPTALPTQGIGHASWCAGVDRPDCRKMSIGRHRPKGLFRPDRRACVRPPRNDHFELIRRRLALTTDLRLSQGLIPKAAGLARRPAERFDGAAWRLLTLPPGRCLRHRTVGTGCPRRNSEQKCTDSRKVLFRFTHLISGHRRRSTGREPQATE